MQNEDPVLRKDDKQETLDKTYFFLGNLFKGLIWLGVIVGGYFYLESHYNFTLKTLLGPVYDQPIIVYLTFLFSEVVFGLLPPELFMIWSLRDGLIGTYVQNVIALSVISYLAGIIGYYFGSWVSTTRFYRIIRKNYLRRVERHFNKFGGFLIVVAALTPVPFSAVCMLMGTVKYPMKKFLLITVSRFVRFGLYAMIVWEANILQ